jgi:hypothetical protein
MKINVAWMRKNSCADGVKWFQSHFKGWVEGADVVKQCMKDGDLKSANRGIVKLMTYKQYVRYAVYAAKQVIDIYERKHPDDKRPRKAIQAVQKCIKNPSKKNKRAAYAAAYAAYAAYAAAAAAANAAYAAADAANAVVYAAAAANAAVYAANSAAKKEMRIKILKYGLRLLKDK